MVVLAEVARRMRARGKPEFEVADIFMDFNAIQMTLAVMAQALIDGRIDCKTAGRLLVHLQTMSKLLRVVHGKTSTEARRHGEQQVLRQICAEERRSNRGQQLPVLPTPPTAMTSMIERAFYDEEPRGTIDRKTREFPEEARNMEHGTWEEARAA